MRGEFLPQKNTSNVLSYDLLKSRGPTESGVNIQADGLILNTYLAASSFDENLW